MKNFILFIFATIMFARLNPFEPVMNPNKVKKVKRSFFKSAKVYLPQDARVLKKVIFVYQSVSSDIKQKEFDINKDIDFHSPIILLHKQENFYKIKQNFKFIKILIDNKTIYLKTKDKLIRSFFLVKPFRLVLDFKRPSDFYTIKKNFNSFVKKIIIGAHSSFYRVVIYLDANYNYKLRKVSEGIKIELY